MSFISVLFGMALSTLIMVGLIQGYVIAKKSYLSQQRLLATLNAGRTTFQYLHQDIRKAGYKGCRTHDATVPIHHHYSPYARQYSFFRFDRTVFGFLAGPGACYGNMPDIRCKKIKHNSPVLLLYNIPQKINPLTYPLLDPKSALSLPPDHGIHENSLVLISDCMKGDVFIANQVYGSKIHHDKIINVNETDQLSGVYPEINHTEVMELQTVAYYLGIPERYSNKRGAEKLKYALFRDNFLQQAQEIVADIDEINFEFGLKKIPTDPLQYRQLGDMEEHDWPWVYTVRIHLMDEHHVRWNYEIRIKNRCTF